jgi:hypothetical protein
MISLELSKVINRYNVDIGLKLSLEIRRYCFTESNGSVFSSQHAVPCTEAKI